MSVASIAARVPGKDEAGDTYPQYTRDVLTSLEKRKLDVILLVGRSLGALVWWEYVEPFGTNRIRALVNVGMEAAPFRWGHSDHGTYHPERLRDIHVGIQTDHLEFIENVIDHLLKEPPLASLRRTMFDEGERCPPAIKSAIILEATMRDYRDVPPMLRPRC